MDPNPHRALVTFITREQRVAARDHFMTLDNAGLLADRERIQRTGEPPEPMVRP